MTSPYLERPLRSCTQIIREIIANCRETYLVVDLTRAGEPYINEGDFGQSLQAIVRDIADGQYDYPIRVNGRPTGNYTTPLAVIRISVRDNEAEDVTDTVAEAVLQRLIDTDDRRPCPFLDEVMPDWRIRSGLKEEAA